MSDFKYIALRTYGREKQRDQSCFKLGQGVNTDILLNMFGSRAVDLTPPQASYRYIHLDVKGAATHQYYLVLRVTEPEKAQVEQFARTQGHFVTVYLWEAEGRRWLQFPCSPQAHYIDPASYGGAGPRFTPSAAPFLTPSRMEEENGVDSGHKLTVERSGDWWWIGGDTYQHRETLRSAGAHWSKKRQQWYVIGNQLPTRLQALVEEQSPTPGPTAGSVSVSDSPAGSTAVSSAPIVASISTAQSSSDGQETADDTLPEPGIPESLMRSVRTDDVTAALVAHIHDSERNKPILIDFIGSRNAVRQLLSKPFNPAFLGPKAEGHAFTVVDGDRYSGFRLPDTSYKTLTAALNGRAVEGRLVALDATTAAPRTECYVLVMDRIELPRIENGESIEDRWLRYVRYRQTPNRPEFAGYVPPTWAADLYNVYQALRSRIGRPLHERWMPWLFEQVADKPVSSERLGLKGITLCKYLPGYLDPKARGVVEGGAYRLTCRDLSALWAEVLIRNPNRAEGITFGSAS